MTTHRSIRWVVYIRPVADMALETSAAWGEHTTLGSAIDAAQERLTKPYFGGPPPHSAMVQRIVTTREVEDLMTIHGGSR